MNLSKPIAALLVAGSAMSGPAAAADDSGASAWGYAWGDFRIGCNTCGHYPLVLDGDAAPYDGGPGATSAHIDFAGLPNREASGVPQDYTLGGMVSMAATATLEGPLSTPLLGARAFADNVEAYLTANGQFAGVDYYGAIATADVVQRYTYVGTQEATYTFTFRVDGSEGDNRASVGGYAGFFDDYLERSYAFNARVFQAPDLTSPPSSFDETFELTMTFAPGSSYYLHAWLSAEVTGTYATGETFADASNTMRVVDITGGDLSLLVPTAAVPEPPAPLLALAGTALLLALRRRRLTAAQAERS